MEQAENIIGLKTANFESGLEPAKPPETKLKKKHNGANRFTYADSDRLKTVKEYKQEYRQSGMSIDAFAKQKKIHQTTMRNWLQRYDPAFLKSRKNKRKNPGAGKTNPIASEQTGDNQVTSQPDVVIENEWYQDSLKDLFEESSNVQQKSGQKTLITALKQEIDFLKKQVVYWMKQEPML